MDKALGIFLKCSVCGDVATHKIAEDTPELFRHPFTNYVCCRHFGELMGIVAKQWCDSGHMVKA